MWLVEKRYPIGVPSVWRIYQIRWAHIGGGYEGGCSKTSHSQRWRLLVTRGTLWQCGLSYSIVKCFQETRKVLFRTSIMSFPNSNPYTLFFYQKHGFRPMHFHHNTSWLMFTLNTSTTLTTLSAVNSSSVPPYVVQLALPSNQNCQFGAMFFFRIPVFRI